MSIGVRWGSVLAGTALLGPAATLAQNINPDISVIGDVRALVERQDQSIEPRDGDLQLDLHGVELALQGHLNPFARADVFIGYHDGEFELEEAYATILRGLPLKTQLRLGKYRVDFGKLNLLHPHAYSFLDPPLVHQQHLGAEGLTDVGLNASWQIPLGAAALTLSGNLLSGDFAQPHEHEHHDQEDGEHHDAAVQTGLGSSQRIALFAPTGDYAGVEFGVNALQGDLDQLTGRRVRLLGADVKFRSAPDKYRSLTIQGEWIRSVRDVLAGHDDHEVPDGELEDLSVVERRSSGFYAFVDRRFRQRWNLGALVERAEAAEHPEQTLSRWGIFGGFQVMEETTLVRLLVRQTDDDAPGAAPLREIVLQLIFSLGPHRPHWF